MGLGFEFDFVIFFKIVCSTPFSSCDVCRLRVLVLPIGGAFRVPMAGVGTKRCKKLLAYVQ